MISRCVRVYIQVDLEDFHWDSLRPKRRVLPKRDNGVKLTSLRRKPGNDISTPESSRPGKY
jgi:hypothetical protein